MVARRMHGSPDAGVDHADHRHPVSPCDVLDRGHLDRVAGDDQHLHVPVDHVLGDLEGERSNLPQRPRPIREPAVVAHVQDRFARQQIEHRARHGQPPDARVEDADRPVVYHQSVSETFFSARSNSGAQACVDRYFHPPSASTQTTSPRSSSDATRRATCSTAPDEMPAKMPSRSVSSRVAFNESEAFTRNFRSRTDSSRIGGTNPSSSERSPYTRSPSSGSAAITFTLASWRFSRRPTPVSVPPVPSPATTCVVSGRSRTIS